MARERLPVEFRRPPRHDRRIRNCQHIQKTRVGLGQMNLEIQVVENAEAFDSGIVIGRIRFMKRIEPRILPRKSQ